MFLNGLWKIGGNIGKLVENAGKWGGMRGNWGGMGDNGEIIGRGSKKDMVLQEKNGGKWKKIASNFPIINVFTVPIFHIFPEGLTGNWHFPLQPYQKWGIQIWGESKVSAGPRKAKCIGALPT